MNLALQIFPTYRAKWCRCCSSKSFQCSSLRSRCDLVPHSMLVLISWYRGQLINTWSSSSMVVSPNGKWRKAFASACWCSAKFTSPYPLGWHGTGSVIAFFCGYVSPYLVVEPVATRSDLHEAFTFFVVRQVKIRFVSNHRRVFDHVIEAQLAARVPFFAPYCVKVAL